MKEDWKIISGEHYINQWEALSEEEKLGKFLLRNENPPMTTWVRKSITQKGYIQISQMVKRIYFSYHKRKFFTRCSFSSAVITPHTIRGDKQVVWCYLRSTGDLQKLRRNLSAEAIYHFLKTGEVVEFLLPRTRLERYYGVSFETWGNLAEEARLVAKRCYFAEKSFNKSWSSTRIKDEYTRLQAELAKEESLLYPDIPLNRNHPLRVVMGPFLIINSERDLKYWSLIFHNCSYSYRSRISAGGCLLFIYHEGEEPIMGEVILNSQGLVQLVQYLGKYNKPVDQSTEFRGDFKDYMTWFKDYLDPELSF